MKISQKIVFFVVTALLGATIAAIGRNQIPPIVRQLFSGCCTNVEAQVQPSYGEYEKKIIALTQNRDLEGLVGLHRDLEKSWDGSFATKAHLIYEIIDSLTSYDFGNPSQYSYAIMFSTDVLTRADEIPVNTERLLVEKLQSTSSIESSHLTAEQLCVERNKRLAELRHLYSRVSRQLDPSFNPKDPANRPVGNVVAPGSYPAGIDPKSIQEPYLRANYEAAIEANRLKAERYSQQLELQDLQKRLPSLIERFFINLYSLPPVDSKDLETQMRLFNLDKTTEDRIKAVVQSSQR